MATVDQKEEFIKQQNRLESDAPTENLETTSTPDAIVSPSLERVIETGFDYNAAINRINEDYADLQKRIDEPGLFLPEPGDYKLQQEKNKEIVDAKLKYAESKIGAPVQNHNKMGFWISTLLQRYKTPEIKQNAFKYFYPEGDMMEVPIVGTDGKKKVITVYRRNQDEDYGLLYPFGRDVNEFGVVGAEVLSARTIGATAMFLLDPTKNPAIAAGVGDYLGIKVDKLINWATGEALGFEGGEGEFYGAQKLSDVNILDFLPLVGKSDSFLKTGWNEDVLGSFLTTAFTKGIGIGTNLITGQTRPTLVPITNEIIKIAEELGLPPVVVAQMAVNPIIQKIFFRAGDITGITYNKTLPQRAELFSRLKAYGIGLKSADDVAAIEKSINLQYQNGDFGKVGTVTAVGAKNRALQKALQEASEGNSITWADWETVMASKTIALKNAMEPYTIIDPKTGVKRLATPTEGYIGLQKAFDDWDLAFTKKIDVIRASAVNNSKGVSYTIGGNNSLKSLINELETGTGVFQGSSASNVGGVGTVMVWDDALGKVVPQKIAVDLTKKSNEPLLELINNIKALDDVIINPKTNTPNLGAIKGKASQWDSFSQLEVLRSKAYNLISHEDAAVRAAAREIHQKIKNIMVDNSGKFKSGGSNKYNKAMSLYLRTIDDYEKVMGLKNMQMAISNKINPEEFATKFFQPGNGYDLVLLKEALGPDNVNWMAFEKSFKANLLRDGGEIKKTLNLWQKQDPDGLSTLLKPKEIDDLMSLGDTFETMNNSLVKKAFENQSSNTIANTRELVNQLVKTADDPTVGSAKIIEDFINGSGGMDGKIINNIRSGIIEDILNKSSVLDEKTAALIIKPKKLIAELEKLNKSEHMKMFFTKQNLETLDNFWLYTNVLGATSDIGGKLAAAELGGEVVKTLFDWKKAYPTLKTLLAYNIAARVLGRDLTPRMLQDLFKPGLHTSVNFTALRSLLGSIMSDFMEGDYEKQREIGVGVDVPDGIVGSRSHLQDHPMSDTSQFKQATDRINLMREVENIKEDANIQENQPRFDQQSSLANPNLGFRSVGAGSADPNTYAQGQQLFGNNPREITFANQGGIMSTNKAFQRVA